MNARERILAAWNGRPGDHVPLTTWCFGLQAPPHLRWERGGQEVRYWYSLRMEHIHTTLQPWELEDDLWRVLAWQSLGVDDVLEVSVPWSVDPQVTWEDARAGPVRSSDFSRSQVRSSDFSRSQVRSSDFSRSQVRSSDFSRSQVRSSDFSRSQWHPLLVREYHTPSGSLRHEIRQTGEDPGPGWVIQPDHVPLFEDYNIPRGVRHAVSGPADVPIVRHLYKAPDARARDWFAERMKKVKGFADLYGVPVQAWSAFGMDGIVWMAGAEGAVLMAMDDPAAFGQLVEVVAEADYGRTALAASTPGVDMVVERGWYSSTDFWSPRLFDAFVVPHVAGLASLAHRHGRKFGYVMTTGVETLGPRLADAGVDVLYFVDPVQDGIALERACDLLGDRLTLVGGINALTLASGDPRRIDDQVRRAIQVLGPTHRFILHPVDALFPDTPWAGVAQMIESWRTYR